MVKIVRIFKTLFSVFFVSMALAGGGNQAFAQVNCVPTCVENDGKLLVLAPPTFSLDSLAGEELRIEVITDAAQLELGIFDPDHSGTWDLGSAANNIVRYTVYADPDRTGRPAGLTQVFELLSDDSNATACPPTPDDPDPRVPDDPDSVCNNAWRDITLAHHPDADDGQGNHSYLIDVAFQPGTIGSFVTSTFKIRVLGEVIVLPRNIIGIKNTILDDNLILESSTAMTIYPELNTCPVDAADFADCGCMTEAACLGNTTNDGDLSFELLSQPEPGEIISELTLWDGDLDYGDGPDCLLGQDPSFVVCGPGPEDTDDPDTPNTIPSFSTSPFVIAEGAIPPTGNPRENNPEEVFVRGAPITYQLVSPDGDIYNNNNPSGTQEWERFTLRLNNHPGGCDNTVADFCVDAIPAGVWTVNILGADLTNLLFFRVEFSSARSSEDATPVPALSRWGILAMILLFGMVILKFRGPGLKSVKQSGFNCCGTDVTAAPPYAGIF